MPFPPEPINVIALAKATGHHITSERPLKGTQVLRVWADGNLVREPRKS